MRIYITVKQLLVVAVFIITSSGPAVAQDAEGAASINTGSNMAGFRRADDDDKYRSPVIFGIQGFWGKSKINDLKTTIMSEPFFIHYDMDELERPTWGLGMFVNYRDDEHPVFGGQLELGFSQQGSRLFFQNYDKQFNYTMDFRYNYFGGALLGQIYPFSYGQTLCGLKFGGGLQVDGVLGSENIFYKADGPGYDRTLFGADEEQQEQLRNVIKGKLNIGVVANIGYEFPAILNVIRLAVDVRYVFGTNDVVATHANSYNFIDNYNNSNSWQIRTFIYFKTKKDD